MRRVSVIGRAGDLGDLATLFDDNDATVVRMWTVDDAGYADCCVPNDAIGDMIDGVAELHDGISIAFSDIDEIEIRSDKEAADSLGDLSTLSPAEVMLAAQHSFGSWTSLLGYSAIAGAVVWIGLLLGSAPFQISAFLVAPFAGPAMNAALATARGDGAHLLASLRRYAGSLATAVVVAGVLHFALGSSSVTNAMNTTANLSRLALLIPLVAGAGGALNLMQSERSSLVSSAATGVLVAASLTIPAGMVGMAVVAGEWPMVRSGLFLLALQLVCINLAGAIVFVIYGVGPKVAGLGSGSNPIRLAGLIVAAVGIVAMVGWQLSSSPDLQRASVEKDGGETAIAAVSQLDGVEVIELDAHFTRPDISNQDTLLIVGSLQVPPGTDIEAETERVVSAITERVETEYGITVLVTVTLFEETKPN